MTKRKPLEGKVVKILNAREVVINLGSDDGVTQGMYFDVLDKDLEDIIDPETGQDLGSIKRVKIILKAIDIGKNISVLSTFKKTGGLFPWGALGGSLIPESYETLKRDQEYEKITESKSIVQILDKVMENIDYNE